MAGRRKWNELRARVAPEVLVEAAVKTEQTVASYRLRDLREALGLTQNQLAERLDVRQVSVSRLEAREDVRVSTLRSVFEALGAKMEIRAVFPDAEYRVDLDGEARLERIEPAADVKIPELDMPAPGDSIDPGANSATVPALEVCPTYPWLAAAAGKAMRGKTSLPIPGSERERQSE